MGCLSEHGACVIASSRASDRHDLFFFGLDDFVDAADEVIGDLLHPVLAMLGLVGSDFFFLLELFEMFDGDAPVIAHRDAIFLSDFFHVLDEFLTAFFGELRESECE